MKWWLPQIIWWSYEYPIFWGFFRTDADSPGLHTLTPTPSFSQLPRGFLTYWPSLALWPCPFVLWRLPWQPEMAALEERSLSVSVLCVDSLYTEPCRVFPKRSRLCCFRGWNFPWYHLTSSVLIQGSPHWRHPVNSCTKYEPIVRSAVCIWESPGVRITMCRVMRLLGLRACALPVCMAVHASAFSPSAHVEAVCLCHSRVSCTLPSPLALAISSMCLERSWDFSTARALLKYHCGETAQPIYSIKSVLHRSCGPGLARSLLFLSCVLPTFWKPHSRLACIYWALYFLPLPQ